MGDPEVIPGRAGVVGGSYPEIPDSCGLLKLAFAEDVLDVLINRPHILLEQLGHQFLRQPDGLAFHADLDMRLAILRLVDEELTGTRRNQLTAHDRLPPNAPRPPG